MEERFFEKNYNNYLESDIKNMIRRLDINKDGAIDLREFYAFLEFPKSINNIIDLYHLIFVVKNYVINAYT